MVLRFLLDLFGSKETGGQTTSPELPKTLDQIAHHSWKGSDGTLYSLSKVPSGIILRGPDGVIYKTGAHYIDNEMDEDKLNLNPVEVPEGTRPVSSTWYPEFRKYEVIKDLSEQQYKRLEEEGEFAFRPRYTREGLIRHPYT